jgi:hypothetical protein
MNTLTMSTTVDFMEKKAANPALHHAVAEEELLAEENETLPAPKFPITDLWNIQRGKRHVSIYAGRHY